MQLSAGFPPLLSVNLDALKRTARWTWIVVVVVLLYAGFVFFNRWQSNQSLEESAEVESAERARQAVDSVGGGELKVLMFYAAPPSIAKGATTRLCYGVAFAEAVRIDPAVTGVRPSLNHCVEAKPESTTTYTLTASDENGQTRTRTVEVTVR
jgi:hypothetical protein